MGTGVWGSWGDGMVGKVPGDQAGPEFRPPVPTGNLGECTSVTPVIRGWGRRDGGSMELTGQTALLNQLSSRSSEFIEKLCLKKMRRSVWLLK